MADELHDETREKGRRFLVWLGWLDAVAVVVGAVLFLLPGTGSDPAGAAMLQGILMLMAILLGLFVGPGLWLAHCDRWLGLSAVLLLLPAFLIFVLLVGVFS